MGAGAVSSSLVSELQNARCKCRLGNKKHNRREKGGVGNGVVETPPSKVMTVDMFLYTVWFGGFSLPFLFHNFKFQISKEIMINLSYLLFIQ